MGTRERLEHPKSLVLAEGNFEEHPFFRIGDRNAGRGVLKYESELRTKEGHVLKQSWTVMAAHGRGLPGRFDQDVYVALLQLIDEKGLPADGWLSFSLYELMDLMGRKHSGRDYQQVRDSLQRLATTSVESQNAFYHRGRKEYISDTFSLLSQVKLSEYEDRAGGRTDRNRVLLSEYFVDSYKANYLKDIDTQLYWSLSSPVAKRLYRLIDKKRNGQRFWEAELFSLRARIPLSDYKYASKIKEKLTPAHEELVEKEFLEAVNYRKGDKQELVGYKISERFHARRVWTGQRQLSGEENFCVQRLKVEGMATETAERLVEEHGATRIMHYVEALPYQKNLRNPAGWLRRAIESGYELDAPPANGPVAMGKPPHPDVIEEEIAEEPKVADSLEGDGLHPSPQMELLEDVPRSEEAAGEAPVDDGAAREAWTSLVEELVSLHGRECLPPWFGDFEGGALDGATLTVLVPNSVAANHLNNNFGQDLTRLWRARAGESAIVQVCTDVERGVRAVLANNDL